MYRTLAAAVALGAALGTAGMAFAQVPPGSYYPPAEGPYQSYAPPPPAAVPPASYPAYYNDGTHTNGGASRAYSYWGAQKSN